MRIIGLAILLFVIVPALFAQTVDGLNGEYWNKLNAEQKEVLLVGFVQGLTGTIWYSCHIDEDVGNVLAATLYEKIKLEELQKRIDQFYSDKKNIQYPIWLSVWIVLEKVKPAKERVFE